MADTLKPSTPQASSPSPVQVHGGHPPSLPQTAGAQRHSRSLAPPCGPSVLILVGSPTSLGQALFHRCVVRDPAANRHRQEGKKTAPGRGTPRKGPKSSQNYKASQQQHGHHTRSDTAPCGAHGPQSITQQKPSPSSSSSRSQSCCVCATSTFEAHFYFQTLHCARSQRPPQPALAPGGSDLPGGPQRWSRWCETRHSSACPHPRISHFVFHMKPPTSALWLPTLKPGQGSFCPAHHRLEDAVLPMQDRLRQWGSAHPGDLLTQGHHNEQQ